MDVSNLYSIPFFGDFAEWGAPSVVAVTDSVSSGIDAIGSGVSSAVASVIPSKTSLYAGGIGLIIILVLVLLVLGKFEAL